MATNETLKIDVLMGIGTRHGQWMTTPADDSHKGMWHPSRKEAMADAAQLAADHGGPVIIHADQP